MHQGKEMQDFKQLSVDKMTPYQKLIGGRIQRVCIFIQHMGVLCWCWTQIQMCFFEATKEGVKHITTNVELCAFCFCMAIPSPSLIKTKYPSVLNEQIAFRS